jgi:histidinol-phosphate aminotransferase
MLACINPKTRLIFVTNPHNPTGSLISRGSLEAFIAALPADIVLVIDEAYIEFVRDPDCPDSIDYLYSDKIVVGLRTFSKAYGLAGLRIGYGLMPSFLADLLNRVRQPFNVNLLAQAGAIAALEDREFLADTVALVYDELDFLYAALDNLGIGYLESQANFFLIRVAKNADEVFEDLLKQGVIVRSMTSYGYPDCIRVNVGRHHENLRLLKALEVVLKKSA